MSVESEGRCCLSCNRRLPLYQCYLCSTSQQPHPVTRSGRRREKVLTDAELERKVSVKLVKAPKAAGGLGRRNTVKPQQPPEAKVKVKIETEEEDEEEDGGQGGSDEDYSQVLPVQFDDAANADDVSFINCSFGSSV